MGKISAGGNLTVKTEGDARFEGSDLASGGNATISSTSGKVTFDAAKDTTSDKEKSLEASAQASYGGVAGKDIGQDLYNVSGKTIETSGSGTGGGAKFGLSNSSGNSSTAVTGNIQSGGTLSISAGSDAKFVGTNIQSKGDASVSAGGNVDFAAAQSTGDSNSFGIELGASVTKSGKGGKGGKGGGKKDQETEKSFEAGFDVGQSSSKESTVANVSSGGNLTVTAGKNVTLEGTQMDAAGKATITATEGKVEAKEAKNSETGFDLGASLGASQTSSAGTGGKAEKETSVSGGFGLGVTNDSSSTGVKITSGSLASISGGEGTRMAGATVTSGVVARPAAPVMDARAAPVGGVVAKRAAPMMDAPAVPKMAEATRAVVGKVMDGLKNSKLGDTAKTAQAINAVMKDMKLTKEAATALVQQWKAEAAAAPKP